MKAAQHEKLQSVQIHRYTAEVEPAVLQLLQTAFGPGWGDSAFWRWKHCGRPGFSPFDVRIYTSGEATIGCWHMASYSLRLAPGLEVLSIFEGDYALHSDWRGVGIGRDQATLEAVRTLARRGVVARFSFTSRTLYERVYRNRLGYHRVPTITSQYRKLLSNQAIRDRLQAAGAHLLQGLLMQRLVRSRPLIVHVEVGGFPPCSLVIESGAASCREGLLSDPDLIARVPYVLLTIRRGRPIFGLVVLIRALLFGQVRTRRLVKFALRCGSALRA